jgi:hypothetical protein
MALKQTAEFLVPILKTEQVSSQKVWVKAMFAGGDPDLCRHVLNNDRRPATKTHQNHGGALGTLFKEAHFYLYNASATPQIP